MCKKTKIWLITAASLIVIGCIIFIVVMTMFKWDFSKLSTEKYETNTHIISENFKNISMKTDTADIKIELSDDGECRIVCYEEINDKHDVCVSGDTLTINRAEKKHWYENIGINFKNPEITIYLPDSEYGQLVINESTGDILISKNFTFDSMNISLSTGDVKNYASAKELIKIKASTGNIFVEDITAGAVDLSVTTGQITAKSVSGEGDFNVNVSTGYAELSDVTCNDFISSGSTGNISLGNLIAKGKFDIKRSTGDVKFTDCDAAEIFIETDTGSVKGSLLSEKVFIVKTDTGSIDVPKTITGGRCEIETDTGNIKITVK